MSRPAAAFGKKAALFSVSSEKKRPRTKIMGILNLTPDSFSDGGACNTVEAALAKARSLVADGADILDLGAESTRPGAVPLTAEEELARLLPVLRAIRSELKVPISVDTYHAATAAAALAEGADLINDIWGLQYAPEPGEMAGVIAKYGAAVVCMHNQDGTDYDGTLDTDLDGDLDSDFDNRLDSNLIKAIRRFFRQSVVIAKKAGIPREKIILDGGIGFGKTAGQCLELLRHLGELKELDGFTYPLLLGVSRKSFIGRTLGLRVDERLEATGAACLWGISHGADILRVHDVRAISRMVGMWETIADEGDPKREGGA